MINCVIDVTMERGNTRLRPFAQSLPLPLFPVGGRPLIFHHLHALDRLSAHPGYEVRHVFLHGRYAPDDFLTFIDSVLPHFDFSIEYIWEQGHSDESFAALFGRRDVILRD